MQKASSAVKSFKKSKPVRDFGLENAIWDDDILLSCMELLINAGKQPKNGWYKRIASFKKYNLDPNTWCDRISKIFTFKRGVSEEILKTTYGEIEGNLRWNSYKSKQAHSNSLDYKREKHGWDDTEFEKYNKSRAVTLVNMISKYGEDEGLARWDNYISRQRETCTMEYFLKTYGEEGKHKWEAFCDARISNNVNSVSKEETEFLSEISQIYDIEPQYVIEKNYTDGRRTYVYDGIITGTNTLIEYNGDMWHMNPSVYDAEDTQPYSGKLAKDVWFHDQNKLKFANSRGYEVIVVWGSEWKSNREEIKKRIKECLMKKNKI
jgi:hypothetical protein